MAESTGGALDGVRVLDLSTEMGQYAGRLLADLGADTIKVEPPGGDAARGVGPFAGDVVGPETSLSWRYFNANKRSVTCNLDHAGGQRLLRALVRDADVLLESYGAGYMESRGVGYDALRAVRPGLVYVSISGFGREGPHAGWQVTDLVAQAASGVLTLAGDPAGAPQMLGGNQACITASLSAAQGALLAVFHKERTGEGQLVEVSMQEALSIAQETAMQQWDFQHTSRERQGEIATLPGVGTYATRDGYVFSMVGGPAGASWSELIDWLVEEGAGGRAGRRARGGIPRPDHGHGRPGPAQPGQGGGVRGAHAGRAEDAGGVLRDPNQPGDLRRGATAASADRDGLDAEGPDGEPATPGARLAAARRGGRCATGVAGPRPTG